MPAQHDRERVLRLLTAQGPLSRLQLARLTRLEEPTISCIVEDLTKRELIRDSGFSPATNNPSREALLGLSPASAWVSGLDVHSTGIKLCLINGVGQIIARQSFPAQENIEEFATDLAVAIAGHVRHLKLDPDKCGGMGVSVPGLVNPIAGTVSRPVWKWQDFPLAELLENALGTKVHVERDVSCGAYGEKQVGRARNCDHFLYILIHPKHQKTPGQTSQAYGYGLAMVVDGHIHRGSNYAAGEMDEVLALDPMTVDMGLDAEGNAETETINRLLHSLARTAASLTNLIDPELIILCGDRQLLTPERMKEVDKVARQEILNVEARRFKLASSAIGMDGLSYGAAILRLHRSFQERLRNPLLLAEAN